MYRASVLVATLAAASAFTVTDATAQNAADQVQQLESEVGKLNDELVNCLLYTSDAADE